MKRISWLRLLRGVSFSACRLNAWRECGSPRHASAYFCSCTGRKRTVSRPCDTGFAHIAFDVDDVDLVLDAVRRAGVEPLSDPVVTNDGPNAGGKAVYTRDPDGVTIEFIQRPKR